MSLLPSRGPETSGSQDGELQVVGVDEDVASVLDALSSETARDILNAVYEDPGTPSELSDRLDMSIQKVAYHLEKLEDEELIAVAGTQYSEKGQEMTVYEPPEDPLVVFVGTPDRKRTLRSLVERLVPAIGLLTAASVMVQAVFGTVPGLFGSPGGGTESPSGAAGGNETATTGAESTPTPESAPDSDGYEAQDATGGETETPAGETSDAPADTPSVETTEAPSVETTDAPSVETTEAPSVEPTDPTTPEAVDKAIETPTPEPSTPEPSTPVEMVGEATETAVASGGGLDLEPGVAFFMGGLLVLAVVGMTWAYTG